MKTTKQALDEGFVKDEFGYVFKFGNGYELRFEQLLFDEQMYVALYRNFDLLTEKVVIKPGYIKEKDEEK